MTANGILQIVVYCLIIVAVTKPLGGYMARVFTGERTWLHPVLRPLEKLMYKLFGVREDEDMKWTTYAFAMLMFSVVGILLTYVLLRLQGHLPWNPQKFGGKEMTPDLAFNTSNSFATNTNWQAYTPESTVSYFSNMVSLAIHNWMSAATGIAIAVAFVRGFARRRGVAAAGHNTPASVGSGATTAQQDAELDVLDRHSAAAPGIGSFWVDLVRSTVYVLLPICVVGVFILIWQGVPQNFAPYTAATTLEGAQQSIAQGPVASQEVIKMLGTNGGGFFNANSAHPFENPTPLANLLQMLLIFCIPAGLTYTFGKMVGNTKQGWALFGAMAAMFLIGVFICYPAEQKGVPTATKSANLLTADTGTQTGGNMEGKETRFGIANSALFATVTTDASCGAVNGMHDSFTPIGGMVPLFNIMTGEVIFGGVGAGLYGMLMYAVIAVFIAGLMVGRTPEYLGKKIEQFEVKMAMLAVLVLAADILCFTALSANLNISPGATSQTFTDQQKADEDKLIKAHPAALWNHVNNSSPSNYYGSTWNNQNNSGAHGFSEILYAYTSATGNNGSAFAGITANTPYYNLTLGIAMLIGRFLMIIPLLAIAGSVARKKFVPESAGTFPTDSATFSVLLVGTVVIVGALTFFPALALGPIVEHLQMLAGKTF
jgi:K+-transporting ATPase ATPase A chain